MMGCSNKENIEIEKSGKEAIERKTKLSKLYDWDNAMIKSVDDYPNFGVGSIVHNEKYIFFPKDGNKIVRIDKNSSKEEKIIYEFDSSKEKGIGVHLCLGENSIFFESNGDIFFQIMKGIKLLKLYQTAN